MSYPYLPNVGNVHRSSKIGIKNETQSPTSRSLKSLNISKGLYVHMETPMRPVGVGRPQLASIRATPQFLQPRISDLDISENPKGSLIRISDLVLKQKQNRSAVERSLADCEEMEPFRSALLKSNEVLSSFLSENWISSSSGVSFLEKYLDMENCLLHSLSQSLAHMSSLKNTVEDVSTLKKYNEKLLKEKDSLEKQIEDMGIRIGKLQSCNSEEKFIKKQRLWNMERAELENKIDTLTQKLNSQGLLQSSSNNTKPVVSQTSYLVLIQEFKQKKIELQGIIARLQYELGVAKETIASKEDVIQDLDDQLNRVAREVHAREKKEIIQVYSERLEMQHEEIIALIPFKDLSERQADNIKKLQYSLTLYEESEKLHMHNKKKLNENLIDFNDPIFSEFYLYNKHRWSDRTQLRNSGEGEVTESPNFTRYTLNRPSFAAFITLPSNQKLQFKPNFELWLELSIRAILDSKFAEHQMHTFDFSGIPSAFPEFAYDWMGQFYVEPSTGLIEEVEWWKKDHINDNRIMLMAALADGQHLSKTVWEIFTFKQIFNEEISLDELSFFLHCRNLLFDGPQLKTWEGKTMKVHIVSLEKAFSVLARVLPSIDVANDLQEMLVEKSFEKKIDSAIVLRVLLEFFRHEKLHKVKSLKKAFDSIMKAEYSVSFTSFSSLLRGLDKKLTDGQLARAFREAWTIGNSKITFDSIITVSNEYGIFYRQMRMKGYKEKPPISELGYIISYISPFAKRMYSVIEDWKNSKGDAALLKKLALHLGVPHTLCVLNRLEELLEHFVATPLDDYGLWDLEDVYKHYWGYHYKLYMVMNEIPNISSGDIPLQEIKGFLCTFIQFTKDNRMSEIRKHMNARVIQRWYRKIKETTKEQAKKPKKQK